MGGVECRMLEHDGDQVARAESVACYAPGSSRIAAATANAPSHAWSLRTICAAQCGHDVRFSTELPMLCRSGNDLPLPTEGTEMTSARISP
jgi:hypothetical protein